jgi:hypothetical protein
MRIIWPSILCLLLMAGMPTAFAQVGTVLSAIPPNNFHFTGTWDCAGSFRNGNVHRSTFKGSVILDGKWLELSEQDVEPATGYVAKYLIGYHPQQKQLVEFDANNFGAATYTSEQGWKNGLLTMTSSVNQDTRASYITDRFLYSVTDGDTFAVNWQIKKSAASEWAPADQQICRRRMSS